MLTVAARLPAGGHCTSTTTESRNTVQPSSAWSSTRYAPGWVGKKAACSESAPPVVNPPPLPATTEAPETMRGAMHTLPYPPGPPVSPMARP
jgi:hypothetical protein